MVLLDNDVKLRFILDGFGDIDAKFNTIKRLSNLYKTYSGRSEKSTDWSAHKRQLRDTLIALDVYHEGGSYYETAVAIYGKQEADEQFSHPRNAMKSRMQRLRKNGLSRLDGGYLELMKRR